MADHIDRLAWVQAVLSAGLDVKTRRVMCACVGLADCEDGRLDPELNVIGPMSGVRFPYIRAALIDLIELGWLEPLPGGEGKIRNPKNDQGD
jgi:hypothetical protein